MYKPHRVMFALCLSVFSIGCSSSKKPAQSLPEDVSESSAPRIYVTNQVSGDLTVIDSGTYKVIATIPLGKRPRGIHASPDHKTLYVALSGTPIAGPDVDESTLPPPDRSADGIGVFDVRQNKIVKIIQGGADPENFDVSKDGKLLYISNEDISSVSILDITTGSILKTLKMGEQPEGVKVSPDGKFVYVTSEEKGNLAVLDNAAGKSVATIPTGPT